MILLSYDVETTGLDKTNDRVTEVGLALYSTGHRKFLESTGFLVQPEGVPITPEISNLTHVHQTALDRYGYDSADSITTIAEWIPKAEAVVAFNGSRFDRPITENWAKRFGVVLPEAIWIDPYTDIPGVAGEQLITMLAKRGKVNPIQHSALDDAKSSIILLEDFVRSGETTYEAIVERAKSPLLLLQSHQDRTANDDAKKFKFRWQPDHKIWWKAVKQQDVQALVDAAPFTISHLDGYTFEQLDS